MPIDILQTELETIIRSEYTATSSYGRKNHKATTHFLAQEGQAPIRISLENKNCFVRVRRVVRRIGMSRQGEKELDEEAILAVTERGRYEI